MSKAATREYTIRMRGRYGKTTTKVAKARGRKTGMKRLLSPEQESEVRKLICDQRLER